jgi:hypothetical protein
LTKFDDGDDPSYEEVASVSFTDFSIISVEGAIFLRVANPGRSLRDLLNGLETIIGFGFTSKPIMLKKLNMTAVFEAVDSVKMVGLKVSGAVINKDLVARIEFASKQGISVEKMKFLDGLKYAVEASAYELVYQGLRGQLAFSSSGLVKVSGSLAPRLVNLIEQDLPRMA